MLHHFNRKAIYNGNVVTWSDVPILLATSFDNNWHFVLIFPPAQKHLLYFSYKHLTINWLDKTKHVFQTTFKASHTFSKRLFTVIHTFSKRLSGAKLIFYIRLSKYFNHLFHLPFKFYHFVYIFMLTTYRLIRKTLHIFHRKTFEFYLIASQVGLDVLVFLLKGM